ncbi:MAG: HAD family hydrolase, partial [Puniceicoccales bacterium]|nr:HAD family hydrolase [Puniceicoccales bacterium]
REPITFENLKRHIGSPLLQTAQKVLGGDPPKEELEHFCERFNVFMAQTFFDGLEELPGAKWILRELRGQGYKVALLTNKQRTSTEKVCAHVGIGRLLTTIIATDLDKPELRKPEPAYAQLALEQMEAKAEEVVLIGDSETDFLAAKAGNFANCYLVTTGTHSEKELLEIGAPQKNIFPDLWRLGEKVFDLISP